MLSSPSRRSPLALPVILLAQLVIPMSIAGTAVALPEISGELGTVSWQLQWVVNGFNLAFALMTLFWGNVADRVGHDRTFRAGIAIALFGALASTAAGNLLMLDAARVIAGIGAAAVLTGAASILSQAWSGAERRRAFALFGTANGLGLALGPSVSGVLVDSVGWRGVFAAQVAILLVAFVGSVLIPRVRAEEPKETGQSGDTLNLALLKHPGFAAMLLVPVAGSLGFVTLLTYLPNAFSAVKGFPADTAGSLMLLATIPVFVAPMLVGALMSRTGLRSGVVIVAAFAFLVLGNLGVLLLEPSGDLAPVLISMVFLGLGFGVPLGIVDAEALGQVPEERSGSAAGLLNFVRIGSEAVAVAAYAAVLAGIIGSQLVDQPELAAKAKAGQPAAPDVYASALHLVILLAVVLVLLLAVAFVLLRRKSVRTSSQTIVESNAKGSGDCCVDAQR